MIRYRFNARANIVTLILLAVLLSGSGWASIGIAGQLSDSGISGRFFLLCISLLVTGGFGIACLMAIMVMLTMHYVVDRDFLTLHIGWKRYRMPLSLVEVKKYKKRSVSAYWRNFSGQAQDTAVWAAASLPIVDQVIYLQCRQREIVINPVDHVGFLSALYRVSKLREMDPHARMASEVETRWKQSSIISSPEAWRDTAFFRLWLLNTGLLICLTGIVMQGIGYLPRFTVLQYTLEKGILLDSVRRDSVLIYAAILWTMFVLVSVFSAVMHRYERIASYITLGFFPFIQIVVFVAVYGLFRVAG